MHYGEVFTVWTHLLAEKSMVAGYQTFFNHAGDDDLKKLRSDIIENGIRSEIKELETVLKDNSVTLPPAPPERPDACVDHIPPGARVIDPEITAALAADNAAGLVGYSAAMGKCIREDIAAMFGQFHMQKAQFGLRILRMNKEKGWLIPPPLHLNTADHC